MRLFFIIINIESMGRIEIMSKMVFNMTEYLDFVRHCNNSYNIEYPIKIKLVKLKSKIIETIEKIKINTQLLNSLHHIIENNTRFNQRIHLLSPELLKEFTALSILYNDLFTTNRSQLMSKPYLTISLESLNRTRELHCLACVVCYENTHRTCSCLRVAYCSRECQKSNWKEHKLECEYHIKMKCSTISCNKRIDIKCSKCLKACFCSIKCATPHVELCQTIL